MKVAFTVNGAREHVDVDPRRTLADALREDLGLTGTHLGCEHGVCGACTILVDGEPVRACLMFAVSAQGHDITTVEGLGGADGQLGPAQPRRLSRRPNRRRAEAANPRARAASPTASRPPA